MAVEDKLLDHKSNNFLASICFTRANIHGVAFLDISTGEFLVSEGDIQHIEKLIHSFLPKEIIFSKSYKQKYLDLFGEQVFHFTLDEWIFTEDFSSEKLQDQFSVNNFKGFGIEDMLLAKIAAGSCLHYLSTTENGRPAHINSIKRIHADDYLWMDKFTIKNLELVEAGHSTGTALIDVLDKTSSPMGARMLKKWLLLPLIDYEKIRKRLGIVEFMIKEDEFQDLLTSQLKSIGDLERLISKISLFRVNPRELNHLKNALIAIKPILSYLKETDFESIKELIESFDLCDNLVQSISKQLVENPPTSIQKGGVIATGFHEELDDLRNTISNSKDLLLDIQKHEAEKTGINNLKIGFNNVFGYFLEVTNRYKDQGLIPDNWVRKQTLSNAERYVTEELKKLEHKILTAEERIKDVESELFDQLILEAQKFIHPVQKNADCLGYLDCLSSFARLAIYNQFCKPEVNETYIIDIKDGRHPVIEELLPIGESYVPNDIHLNNEDTQIMMITGPNMSGKSAVLRQTALICLLAQMGSYVPASSAKLGIIDKLFSRVGASDNISSGESTFMVEMNETASIMNNISSRSLILMDEIGRGTSTYDGISIAWSLAEYLHDNKKARPKTLFATHYHELNELANRHSRIKNYNVSVKEIGQKVLFLRKLVAGGSLHSFGIHVAKMAGITSKSIVERAAHEILVQLEQKSIDNGDGEKSFEGQPGFQIFRKKIREDLLNQCN